MYQDYKKNTQNMININTEFKMHILRKIIHDIKLSQIDTKKFMEMLFSEYASVIPEAYLGLFSLKDFNDNNIIALIHEIVSQQVRRSFPKQFSYLFSEVHNVPWRFPFLYNNE